MALWDIAARILTQLASSSIGLVIKRFSSGATANLQEWQDENGNYLSQVRPDGSTHFNGYTSWQMFSGLGRVEFILYGAGTGCEWRMWNSDESKFHFRSYTDHFQVPTIQPGAINAYNSLTALKMSGLATASGAPTANTWVAGDWFIDSKGVPQLCTTGGTPGTWAAGGWQLAGFYKFASALATSGAITIPAFDELMIVVNVVSISSTGDIPALRFNNDSTAAHYRSRFLTNAATSGVTLTDVTTSTSGAALAKLSGVSSAGSRTIVFSVQNIASITKVGALLGGALGSGSATVQAAGTDLAGNIEWNNTSAQITSVTMLTAGATLTFGIGSGFQVFGRDFA